VPVCDPSRTYFHAFASDQPVKLATIAFPAGTAAAVANEGYAVPIPGYADVGQLLRAGDSAAPALRGATEGGNWQPYRHEDLRLPIQSPSAVFCVGLNYRAHIEEMGRDLPAHPTLFSKLARTLTDPYAVIELPAASDRIDYEGELVIVIGRGGRDIRAQDAPSHIGGYALMNDVTMRDWQNRTLQWFAGKNLERSTPVGPYVVTPDEFVPGDSILELTVNGELRQRAQLSDLVFDAVQLIADISRITTLEPGDLIATGTPGGVGHSLDPPSYLNTGDVVEVRVEGLGAITNRFERSA
jgi:acylpyruvate hydrolase